MVWPGATRCLRIGRLPEGKDVACIQSERSFEATPEPHRTSRIGDHESPQAPFLSSRRVQRGSDGAKGAAPTVEVSTHMRPSVSASDTSLVTARSSPPSTSIASPTERPGSAKRGMRRVSFLDQMSVDSVSDSLPHNWVTNNEQPCLSPTPPPPKSQASTPLTLYTMGSRLAATLGFRVAKPRVEIPSPGTCQLSPKQRCSPLSLCSYSTADLNSSSVSNHNTTHQLLLEEEEEEEEEEEKLRLGMVSRASSVSAARAASTTSRRTSNTGSTPPDSEDCEDSEGSEGEAEQEEGDQGNEAQPPQPAPPLSPLPPSPPMTIHQYTGRPTHPGLKPALSNPTTAPSTTWEEEEEGGEEEEPSTSTTGASSSATAARMVRGALRRAVSFGSMDGSREAGAAPRHAQARGDSRSQLPSPINTNDPMARVLEKRLMRLGRSMTEKQKYVVAVGSIAWGEARPLPHPDLEDKQRSTKSSRPSWRSSRASRRRASTSDTGGVCPIPSPTSFFTGGRSSPVAAALASVPLCVGLSEEDAQAAATFVSRSSDSRQTPSQLYHNSLFGDNGSGSWPRP